MIIQMKIRITKECITKIDGTTIDDAEIQIYSMLMYNLIKYISNYLKESLWFYSKDEATNFNANF